MLRAGALLYGRRWDKSLSYAKFSYNNSYLESIKMMPFEMLYGCRCQTPLFWNETGERKVFGPGILQEAKKQVRMVRENLWVAQSRQKAMPMREKGSWALKLEILCTSRCHLWEVCAILRYEASSYLGSLDHSRSLKREKKNWRHNFWISFLIRLNLEDKIHFKVVGLSHPKIPNFGMWLKFTQF
jgi:hypothetical protein